MTRPHPPAATVPAGPVQVPPPGFVPKTQQAEILATALGRPRARRLGPAHPRLDEQLGCGHRADRGVLDHPDPRHQDRTTAAVTSQPPSRTGPAPRTDTTRRKQATRQASGEAHGTLLEVQAKEVNRGTAPSVGRYAASDARCPETLDSPFGLVGILTFTAPAAGKRHDILITRRVAAAAHR